MSTKKTTTTTNQYDPTSKAAQEALTKGGSSVMQGYMNNPFSNPAYTQGLQQSMRGATQAGQNNMAALQSQMRTSGMSGGAANAFQMAQMGRIGRANSALMSQANISNVQNALSRQMGAAQSGLNYNPLQTGQNAVQQTSGTGTWLPQLAGAALGAGMGMMTGGMSSALGAFGGGSVGGVSDPALGSPGYMPTNINYGTSAPNPFLFGGFGGPGMAGGMPQWGS